MNELSKEVVPAPAGQRPLPVDAGIPAPCAGPARPNLIDDSIAALAAIVESSDDAIVSKTLEGIIRTWNKGAERIFGYTEDEVIGRPINILIPDDRQGEEPHILARICAGERVDHFETVRKRKDGRLIDVSVTISPIRDASGRIIGASKIGRDITDQKRIERELKAAKEAAEQANRAKDHFLSVLSHELRTPLTPVLAAMSLLESQPGLSGELAAQYSMIRRNVETEARLVDDLLDLTRIARGKVHLHQEIVDAHEALRGAMQMLHGEMDGKSIELSVGMRAKRHHVWADPGRLQQVFLNLLSNAVKFTPVDGQITVRTRDAEADGSLIIQISDTGAGIEPELMLRLFTAFEQSPRSRRHGGLGLGLSIAKALIEMHGGTIAAESPGVDQGSTFTVTFNTVDPPSASAGARASTGDTVTTARVLLVEDHPDTRLVLAMVLKRLGCTVTTVGTVADAIAAGERQPFDLLISDIGLPDGSGIEIMKRLKTRDLRGIAISGFGQDEDLRRSEEAGFEMHLTKPVNYGVLRDTLIKLTS